ncbi:PUA-like domain [Pseudocohnilembus persalinus]|uniref:60S ribosome subunit biogenesis protein NIP7 homolog n=1 Tax=Pseudocohnilembus persalinus TaxID=266149 RepID=A0A0V0Q867_PSEPJ|nr:PUA-like domain [Pseudocohnilembus persalinus]|eukprot:KRW98456.1 PUA-like domain [Pseudocohnilembus persalinus]
MRQLTDDETKVLFLKLSDYLGENVKFLIERTDEPHVFRLIGDRVYYMSEKLMKLSTNVARDCLLHCGSCFGKFTKAGKFKLHVTSLDHLARFAKNKVWLKPQGEQAFVYGNHVIKAHIGRMTDNILQFQGVVVYSMNDTPLGFGIASRGTLQTKDIEHTAIVVINQCDVGEYLRIEGE